MSKEMSDFLKKAYESGRVRDLSEAFKEFPVEEEWHKGKIENVVREYDEKYIISYGIGDIVYVKEYKYEDGRKGSNHFFVIIDQDNTAVPIENFAMIISSRLDKLKYDSNKLLNKDKNNNLNKDSIVKTDVIYTIFNEQIVFKIGRVESEKIEEYKRCFLENLS